MHVRATVFKNGHSWAIRLPKAAFELSKLHPDKELDIEVRPGRLVLRDPKQVKLHPIDQAYKEAKADWDQLMEDAWVTMFGPDED